MCVCYTCKYFFIIKEINQIHKSMSFIESTLASHRKCLNLREREKEEERERERERKRER